MNRVERMFGPREDWDKGGEMERVKAQTAGGQRQGGGQTAKARKTEKKAGTVRKAAPVSAGSGIVPAKAAKAAGFNKGRKKGIKGFVSIRCGGCDKIINTCLREERTIFNCQSCGHLNPLEGLTNLHFKCPRCGFTGGYRTNRKEKELNFECLNCSEIVPMKRVRRGNYVPEVET